MRLKEILCCLIATTTFMLVSCEDSKVFGLPSISVNIGDDTQGRRINPDQKQDNNNHPNQKNNDKNNVDHKLEDNPSARHGNLQGSYDYDFSHRNKDCWKYENRRSCQDHRCCWHEHECHYCCV